MGDKEITRTIADQNQLRRKIQMRYESPSKNSSEGEGHSVDNGMAMKKVLIRYYMTSMNSKRIHLDEEHRVCGFCGTKETSLWRRIGDIIVCNACGLYYRIHGKIRTKKITRGRKSKTSSEIAEEETEEENTPET